MAYFSRSISDSLKSPATLAACSALALLLAVGCEDDDVMAGPGVTPGTSGSGGSGGSGGGGGAGGLGGGDAGVIPSGPTGAIEVLSTATELRGPTTAAVRGNNLWVVNGQLGGLFGGPAPVLPFNVVSLPLTGGAVGSTIELPGTGFYPEGIAAGADGTLFVGSVPLGTVVRVAADSTTAETFVAAGVAQRGVVGLTVDDNRDVLWFCDSNSLAAVPGGAIVGVSLDDASELVRHAMPNPGSAPAASDAGVSADAGGDAGEVDAGVAPAAPGVPSFCNDVIVDGTGNIFATDSSGRIFRVPAASVMTANSASVWLSVPEISPPMPGGFGANGLDIVGDSLIIANNGLVAVDPNSSDPASTVRRITLTLDGAVTTLCGPDGLQTVPGSSTELVVVENGSCNPPSGDGDRVVRITLDLDD